jgi:hypothetical protein
LFFFPFPFANAWPELLSKAAPGAKSAAPIPRFLRNDRRARRLGVEDEAANWDDSVAFLAPS